MEETIGVLRKSLGSFCNHLQGRCDALKRSVDRRPVPLDSASSTFLECLNSRVSETSSELNQVESMALETVSFEELLGHCLQIYKNNNSDLLLIQQTLGPSYVPSHEIDDDNEEEGDELLRTSNCASSSLLQVDSLITEEEEESLLSLNKLGLSDVCLASLASQPNPYIDDSDLPALHPLMTPPSPTNLNTTTTLAQGPLNCDLHRTSVLDISKDDYDSLPSYIKGLTSWEDLLKAVEKINSGLRKKGNSKGSNYFQQDEIASLDLGPKARSYLLLLVRMNKLVVETIDGLISYKVVSEQKL